MATTAKTTTDDAILIPGLASSTLIPRGQAIAVFVKGLETYSSLASDRVRIKGKEGDAIDATVVGSKAGRLFALASETLSQTPNAILSAQRAGNYSFADVAFFNGLADLYGKEATQALEPYTVLIVMADQMVLQNPTNAI